MAVSDALIVGEDFISEHYFTTDSKSQSFQAKVIERPKQWDAARDDGQPTTRSRYTERRGELAHTFLGLAENADADVLDDLYARLREMLGFDNPVRWESERLGSTADEPGPLLALRARGLTGPAPLVIVEARGALALEDLLAKDEKSLLRTYHTEEEEIMSVAPGSGSLRRSRVPCSPTTRWSSSAWMTPRIATGHSVAGSSPSTAPK